jgi:hypothetical protein
MLDVADVASVATVAKPASADKPALAYLEASGARAISIITDVDGAAISVGMKPGATVIFWLPQQHSRSVAARARTIAGDNPDTDAAISALREAAAHGRVTLTEHNIAISRAHAMAERLDAFMDSMRGTGVLKEFTRTYKQRRIAAAERGEGFMSYGAALARLRQAMIPILMNNGKPVVGASLFAEVFNTK